MRNHRLPQLISAAAILLGALVGGGSTAHAEVTNLQVAGTYRPAALDWSGDGNTDVLWYKPGAASHSVWYGSDTGLTDHVNGTTTGIPAGNYTPLVGFFSGTRQSAIFYDPAKSVGRWCRPAWLGPNCSDIPVPKGAKPYVTDLDENYVNDIVWYVPGTGTDTIWYGSPIGDFSPYTFHMDSTTAQPLFVNSDNKNGMDILWYAPGSAADALWLNKGKGNGTFTSVPEAINGTYQPVVGGFNGPDYQDDIFWYAPGATVDHLWRSKHDGTWTSVPKTVGGSYQATQFFGNALLFINPSGADELWVAATTGQDPTKQDAADAKSFGAQADLPGGVQRLNLTYKGLGGEHAPWVSAIFWYGPGSIADQQWYGWN
jgi:hypothetical protein